MSATLTASSPAYTIALQSAAFYHVPGPGFLRISGLDRAGFIQRQTTNDIRRLSDGQVQVSVLTNPSARILDVFYLLAEGADLAALTLPGRGTRTAAYLKSRIFFMDKVTVSDESLRFDQFDLLGPQTAEALTSLGATSLPSEQRAVSFPCDDVPIQALAHASSLGSGYRLLVPAEKSQGLQAAMAAAGLAELGAQEYNLLRIEAGLPSADRELREDYTPLEVGLGQAISDSKGCYTGQEVIARQVTYDKITQRLCGLRLEAEASPGQRVWADSRAVGSLTSVAHSPRFGWIGLGVIKRPHDQPGSVVVVGQGAESEPPAQVTVLPFG